MAYQSTLVEEPTDRQAGNEQTPDQPRTPRKCSEDGGEGEVDLLTLSEPTTKQCQGCGFVGTYWDFDQINPVAERYRRKEQAADNYRERRSARKNRLHARDRGYSGIACPEPDCDCYGDAITEIDAGEEGRR